MNRTNTMLLVYFDALHHHFSFRSYLVIGVALLLLASIVMVPSESGGTPPPPEDMVLKYTLNRSAVPALTYNDLTLRIYIGTAEAVSAQVDGQSVPIQYDSKSGYALLTTRGTNVQVDVKQGVKSFLLGSVTKTILKDNKKWAWSHSFDDNTSFKKYGIPAFDAYGWRATVYLIGNKLSSTRDEDWIVDRPDIVRLVKKGWGIGNHTWTHTSVNGIGGPQAAAEDIKKLDLYLRQAVNEAGRSDYRLMSFAAPAFDSNYMPVILNLRNSGVTGLLFNESGNVGFQRVDPGGREPDNGPFGVFDYNLPIGRIYDVHYFGTGHEHEQTLRKNIAAMHAKLDDQHHYWLNTFTHDVDDQYPNASIFAFLPWLYQNYGPGGDNSVWVAPAEEIYSYFLVRDRVSIRYEGPDPLPAISMIRLPFINNH